jgi:hypothetical protein
MILINTSLLYGLKRKIRETFIIIHLNALYETKKKKKLFILPDERKQVKIIAA